MRKVLFTALAIAGVSTLAAIAPAMAESALADDRVEAQHATYAMEQAAAVLVNQWREPKQARAIEQQLAGAQGEPTMRQLLPAAAIRAAGNTAALDVRVQLQPGKAAGPARYVAWPPPGDDLTARQVPALDLRNGQFVWLDAKQAPAQTVLLLGMEADSTSMVDLANARLAAAGLQSLPAGMLQSLADSAQKAATSAATTRLDRISVLDDKEPWVSGNAEIYLLVSGVLPGNQAQIFLVDLPYLDNEGVEYYPRQIIADWRQFGFQAVNVLLYEHDDNTSYQALVQALIGVIGEIGSLAGYPAALAIEEIASAIVAAMPGHWFANADDFVDAVYTIEKNVTERGRWGARANVKLDLTPYLLPGN